MNISSSCIFTGIPAQLPIELCQTLFSKPTIRVERIVSKGHCSAENEWYDQNQDEWVILLQGAARLTFAQSTPVDLKPGDYLLIPAHCRHRVDWTDPDMESIWLAIHIFEAPAAE
ncbi:MAG: phosphoribosylaminoimidazole carboxylase [Proteobacteria bacterium ST_bin11]|nr:MAG: phosphoribosylaminoimidazole carboxylase [Proteobacteria bacterium ST_bin11]